MLVFTPADRGLTKLIARKVIMLRLALVSEVKVRLGGYNNFSFREIANEVGIKSARVHYHFPTKADLGAELAHQYTDAFLGALGDFDEIKARGETSDRRVHENF